MLEPWVTGILPKPPGVARSHELLVQAPPIRKRHFTEKPAVAVVAGHPDRDGLPEGLLRRELLGAFAVCLPHLGRVDPHEADLQSAVVPENRDGVPVFHPDDAPAELLRSRA